AHFDRVVTDPAVRRADVERFVDDPENAARLFLGRYAICHTSGSQGQALLIVQTRLTLELLFALQLTRGNASTRIGPVAALRRLFRPARIAAIALKRGFYPSASAWEHMPAAARAFVRVLRLGPTDPDLVERLNAFRPTALTAYASVLEAL